MDKHEPRARDVLDMKMDRLLRQWPAAAQVLIAYRMACVGCDFAKFHTMQQALEVYNLQASSFMEDLMEAIGKPSGRGSA